MGAEPRLVLLGAGHTHLHLLRHVDRLLAAGYSVTLVAPRWFDYSGTASGVATGARPVDVGRIDVAALAGPGVEHRQQRVARVDPDRRVVVTEDGAELGYDVLSVNLGSVAAEPEGVAVDRSVVRIKPLDRLAGLGSLLEQRAANRVTVVGGGPSGAELAANLAARADVARVHLLHGGPRLAPSLPRRASRRLARLLADRGVVVRTGVTITEIGPEATTLADGELAHDVAVLAIGLAPPPLAGAAPLGGPHGVPVRATLQHTGHDEVYAVGDCADFVARRLPRIGVHGVRQGPVLLAALEARAAGGPAPRYEPRREALAILDLGDTGLAARGRWWWHGSSALRLKRRIDRRWVADHRA